MTEALSPIPSSPFLPDTKLQFAWDSTSLTTFMECPRKYQLRILEGWVTRSPKRQVALDFGILMHRGIELYHVYRSTSVDHEGSVFSAITSIMHDTLFQRLPTEEEIAELKEDEDADDSEHKVAKVRTRYHLIRALVWYFENYAQDTLRVVQLANGRPAVELSFRFPTGISLGSDEVIYCGHMDRLVHAQGGTWVVDVKTTGSSLGSSYFRLFDISHQMTGYTLAGTVVLNERPSGVIIDGISLLVGGAKFGRAPTHRSKSQLTEFVENLGHYVEQAERFHDEGHYPLNTTSCRFCEYVGICSQPPEVRQLYLNQKFQRGKTWNPLENR